MFRLDIRIEFILNEDLNFRDEVSLRKMVLVTQHTYKHCLDQWMDYFNFKVQILFHDYLDDALEKGARGNPLHSRQW